MIFFDLKIFIPLTKCSWKQENNNSISYLKEHYFEFNYLLEIKDNNYLLIYFYLFDIFVLLEASKFSFGVKVVF